MKYRLKKFTGYSLEDCDCSLCLHYAGKGKLCPLDTCCCAEEKQEAIEKMQNKPDLPPLRRRHDPLQPERPTCYNGPACVGCGYPGHGFICGNRADCLKTAVARHIGVRPCPA